jgi:LacI family transcriptional regulator
MQGMIEAGEAVGYSLSVLRCRIDNSSDIKRVIQQASHHQFDGLVITPPCDNSDELLSNLHKLRLPFVLLTPHERTDEHSWIAAEDERGSYEATRHVIVIGHTRIAYIKGNRRHQASWDRLAGFQQAMREANLGLPDEFLIQGEWSFESGVACAEQLLNLPIPPTAILTGGDEIAAGVLHAALRRGLTLPRDLSVVGFDNSPLAQKLWPPLTSVEQPLASMTAAAMRTILDNLEHGYHAKSTLVPTSLVVRGSTTPPFR